MYLQAGIDMISNKAVDVIGLPFDIQFLQLILHGSTNLTHLLREDKIFPDLLSKSILVTNYTNWNLFKVGLL